MAGYRHTKAPSLYAYRKGCRCAECKQINAAHAAKYDAVRRERLKAEKKAAAQVVTGAGPIELSVRAQLDGLVDIPWQATWKLLALQHARTLDTIAVSQQNHLAGTAHAKLVECLDRLKPPAPAAGQAVKQGLTDLEAFANDL